MKKIIISIIAILAMFSLVACSSQSSTTPTTAASAQNETQAQKLVVATNAEFPPYEYKEGNQFLGIDMELASMIADKLGMQVEIMDIAFDSLIPAITSNKADIIMAGMTVTEERKQNVSFTDTYIEAVQNIIVTDNSDIKTVDDLKGKKVGVQQGTTGDLYLTDDLGDESLERYNKIYDAIVSLQNGKIDAVVVDDQVAKNLVSTNQGLKIFETPYAKEEYAMAINKNNSDLLNKVNNALKELKADGTIDALKAKYIK